MNKGELPVMVKAYDMAMYIIPVVEKMPRKHKFTLGDRIVNHLYDILEKLVDARYSRQRFPILKHVNLALEKLRMLLRIASEMKAISIKAYGNATAHANDVGVMVGGWMKSAAR